MVRLSKPLYNRLRLACFVEILPTWEVGVHARGVTGVTRVGSKAAGRRRQTLTRSFLLPVPASHICSAVEPQVLKYSGS